MLGTTGSQFRRTRRTAAAVAGVAALTLIATEPGAAAPGQSPFNKGTGSATADSMRVDPVAGGLSFGIGVGQALAGHQNTVGQAEARAFDLGVIGVSLAGEGCDGGDATFPEEDQPQPERISSTDENAEQGRSSTEPFAAGRIRKEVRAGDDPFAEAITTGAPVDIPGVLSVSATRSLARSGVVDGTLREATAVTEIASIWFADTVQLKGLRWEATHRSGSVDETVGKFTIEALTVAGAPVPVEDLEQVNAVLNPLGFELRMPTSRVVDTSAGEIVMVDPLAIAVVPNENRDTLLGGAIGAGQPVREPLFDALIEQDCGNATYVTLADVAIASITGGGTFSVSLGGVRASTAPLKLFQGLGQLSPLPPLAPLTPLSPATPGTPGRPAVPGTPATQVTVPATSSGGDDDGGALKTIGDVTGERGGLMALISGGGLAAILAAAEADRRKMRAAVRTLAVEV